MTLIATDIEYLCSAIAERSGNVLSAGQSYLLESRLMPIATTAGLPNVRALVEELRRNPLNPLHDDVTEAMTINETSFFRDMQPFNTLKSALLPDMIERRQSDRRLRLWSAASSSGQEAYSLAALLKSSFPVLDTWNVQILATDISDEMVARTKEGVYTQFEVNRGLPASMLVHNFERKGLNWQAKPELRNMVEARKMNLTRPWAGAEKHDIVFLRNVLIYFDQQTKLQILRRVHQSMNQDSYLFLGGGETLIQLDVPFERLTVGKTVCFRPVAE